MSPTSAKRLLVATFICLNAAGAASAQSANSIRENSPYSRYGIGDLRSGTNASIRGMGYASTAYNAPTTVNADNPASYSFIRIATLEGGGEGNMRTVYSDGDKYSTGSATVSYLNVGLPLGKRGGMAFGLRPHSRVFYNLVDTASMAGIGKTARTYTGEGGLNYAYLGGAYQYKGFSVGVNAGYMFGTNRNSSMLYNIDTTDALNSDFSRYTKIGGIYWKGGLQYRTKLSKKMYISAGATISASQNLTGWRDDYTVAFLYQGGSRINDTAFRTDELKDKVTLPMNYSIGVQTGSDNWSAGVDLQISNWEEYRSFGRPDSLANTMRLNAGVEYTPSLLRVGTGYMQQVTYRIGGYIGNDYIKLRDTQLPLYGLTVGASFPFRRGFDRIHTSFELGKRGTNTNNLIRETFYRFTLGFSLNEVWFVKQKYD